MADIETCVKKRIRDIHSTVYATISIIASDKIEPNDELVEKFIQRIDEMLQTEGYRTCYPEVAGIRGKMCYKDEAIRCDHCPYAEEE